MKKKIKNENEINEEDNTTNFCLTSCIRDINGQLKCDGIRNLSSGCYPLTIDLNGSISFITDKNGNIIYDLSKKTTNNKFSIERYIIEYIDKDNMILSSIKNTTGEVYQMEYIHYVKNNIQRRNIFDHRKGGTLEYIEIPNPKKKTAIIKRKNLIGAEEDTRLFSIERGKFISPSLSNISKIKDIDDVLRFDDVIYSNKEIDKRKYSTTITGYITLDGIMNNKVYDSEIDKIRDISTKEGRLMEGYKIFRNKVKNELDYKFEEEQQIERRKKKFETKSLQLLKNRKVKY